MKGPKGWASQGKTKTEWRERQVPLHPVLVALLGQWMADGWERWVCRRPFPADWLLPSPTGRATRPRSAELLRADLASVGVEAPKGFHRFHQLRACFATWLEEAGASEGTRSRLLGHRGKSTAAVHYTAALLKIDRAAVAGIPVTVPDPVPPGDAPAQEGPKNLVISGAPGESRTHDQRFRKRTRALLWLPR
ncbi:tyrosine-type recombinase/integrase [Polyangium aurulentum]|uniref:tyrosine-type recombinase/integrase n=1 Tax=Polyangium aurulentum TaxID=2567896 RepID=UPI0010ADE2AF|nr:tyrosine-type recombinase/integrase [Polyangium aurulentum]